MQSSGEHFKKNFSPRDYLNEYYTHIGAENKNLLEFFAKCYKKIPTNVKVLEFGGGPTIYQLISIAKKASEIHFADFLDTNLREIKLWKEKSPKAFNWSEFVKKALKIEGLSRVQKKAIREREEILRNKLTKLLHCDAFKRYPLGKEYQHYYDVLSMNFCADSITSTKKDWQHIMATIVSLLSDRGILIMTALENATHWKVAKSVFPAVNITEKDVKSVLKDLGFRDVIITTIPAEVTDETAENYEGYKGMIFVLAKKVKKT